VVREKPEARVIFLSRKYEFLLWSEENLKKPLISQTRKQNF
jgi:hypothetical protein